MTENEREGPHIIAESQLQALSWALGGLSKDNQLLREIRSHPLSEEIRKARDNIIEVLDELRTYAKGEYQESSLSDNEREMRIHLEYENRIWGIMKSLRGEGP